MERIEGKRPVIDGLKVYAWLEQAELAELLDITERQIQNLEKVGLPAEGHRSTKRYPIPHAVVWYSQYQFHVAQRHVVESLPFPVALAEHNLFEAESEARREGQLLIRRRGTGEQ
jgi:phage terminase Nu1 subunit (DNA packaging protein)